MTALIFNSKWKIAINDHVDYPLLPIKITYTDLFFSRNLNVILHVSIVQIVDWRGRGVGEGEDRFKLGLFYRKYEGGIKESNVFSSC